MNRTTFYLACSMFMLLAVSAQAVIPSPLPPITVTLEPNLPGQVVDIRVGGTWPDSCYPATFEVTVGAGPTMWIDLMTRGVIEPPCPNDCGTEPQPWELLKSPAGPFPAGEYTVYARVIDCNATGPYEVIKKRWILGNSQGGGQPTYDEFAPGQRVVLLEDDQINGLIAGQAGTVVCCDSNDCSGQVLVSWDLWAGGKSDASNCAASLVLNYPPNSTTWVNPNIAMTVARPFNQCGTVRKGLEGCIYFEADNGKAYTVFGSAELYTDLDTPGGAEFDQRMRLQGLLDTAMPDPNIVRICPVRDGDIYHPILSACQGTSTGCCGGELYPGDRVTLLTDRPAGPSGVMAPGLMAGTTGTVICCAGPYGANWVFVSWDGFTDGVNADTSCGSAVIPYVRDSGWWVPCNQITLEAGTGGPGSGFVVRIAGNAIRLEHDMTAPNPDQTLIGCTTATIQASFKADLSVEVIATSVAGGTWTGTITPSTVDAGTATVQICVRGENVDLTALPPGANRQLASTSIFAVPTF